ncbi:hypothetical protein PoB_003122600 [Plakobranchus ocellatus]|uniref:C2H2-type domain-containing protein n=1 Tax=Plakobranchus ocellatus TaxID=259542 RepID=A0AAV4A0H2_9GAST|nr:hypothetical protein PoB_003122600 [Plakobranchus ocellatus]
MEDSAAPQADQVLDSSSEAENSQESFNPGVQMKVEPDYNGSDQSSSADSETSSPLPPVHFGIMSPQEGNASPLTDQSESVEQAKPQKLNCAGNKSAQSHGGKGEKKTISVQNIVEGLRRKSETRMALSGSSGARSSCHKSKTSLDGILEKHEPAFPTSGQNSVFPISHQLQARISTNRDSNRAKQHIVRPNSPTRTCDSLLTDKTHFTYAIMESSVDEEAAKIFNVQNHELVCAIGSKSLVSDKTNRVVASLDFGYFWCNFCPYTTNNKDGLIQHVLEHRFGCKYCPYESFCRSDTVRHMHKMHSEFGESASQLVYCTLLSDYMRIKAHACGQIGKDPDEDVYDPDPNEIESLASEHLSRKRKLGDSHPSDIKSIRLSMESPSATPSWSDSESSFKEKGKSRKNQNPRKHAPPNKTDYDVFSVEVEEVKNQQDPTNETACTENTLQPSEQNLSEAESETLPPGTMQVLPTVTDGSMETYTSKPAGSKLVSLPPKANLLNRGRSNTGTSGSTSTLYWSCGYCSFQSNSQAEIKEHSNKVHPGKPHRYVALIRNMLAEAGIPTKSQSQNASTGGYKHTVQKPALSSIPTNGAQDTLYTHSNPSVSEKVSKRENTIYRCYHCSYTARRHSSLKTHIYHRHRGKGLVAVEEESETGQQMFFCARDDCTFKSDNPGLYLNHVEQCTPWNKPELADVEVEPHIRSCLDQTVAFAETAREKVMLIAVSG